MPSPERDEKGLKRLLRTLAKPRTLKELEAATGQSERTVFRWIRYLEQEGATIVSRRGEGGLTRYWVIP